jgi:hypothetical protein
MGFSGVQKRLFYDFSALVVVADGLLNPVIAPHIYSFSFVLYTWMFVDFQTNPTLRSNPILDTLVIEEELVVGWMEAL